MNTFIGLVGFIVGYVLIYLLVLLAIAYPLMLLWNYVIPDITNGALKEITFWKMVALNVLVSMMFKNATSSPTRKN